MAKRGGCNHIKANVLIYMYTKGNVLGWPIGKGCGRERERERERVGCNHIKANVLVYMYTHIFVYVVLTLKVRKCIEGLHISVLRK